MSILQIPVYCLCFVDEKIQEDGHERPGYEACYGSGPRRSTPIEGGGVHGKEAAAHSPKKIAVPRAIMFSGRT